MLPGGGEPPSQAQIAARRLAAYLDSEIANAKYSYATGGVFDRGALDADELLHIEEIEQAQKALGALVAALPKPPVAGGDNG
jgi:hypothetical protein